MSESRPRKFLPVIAVFLLLSVLFPVVTVVAQSPTSQTPSQPVPPTKQTPSKNEFDNPLNAEDFTQLFVSIANWIAGIVATVAVLMIVIAGLQYIFSGGDTDKIQKATKTIQWSLIGLVIVIMSWSLLKTILTLLNVK